MVENAYSQAGVDVEAGYEVVERIKKHVARTERLGVLGALGGFGGAFDLSALKKYDEPVLISGTDGVGTKLLLAIEADKHDTIGIDAVAMCVNDIIAAGAEPLYFLDYIATGKNVPEQLEQVVAGVAEGCVQAGAALIGGETAEMPGMYEAGHYDLAGFAVGIAEKRELIDGARDCQAGDVLIGLPSSGLHSNGFSLVRKIVAETGLTDLIPELLTPTKIYVKDVLPLVKQGLVQGIAHITGGGFIENLPRMFGKNLTAVIDKGSWPVKPIFTQLQEAGKLDSTEVYEYFNMGIGMVLAVKPSDAAEVLRQVEGYEIGRLTAFDGQSVVIK